MKKTQEPNLVALEEFVNTHPKMVTMRQMRRTIKNAQFNKADIWIRRVNRRIFVDVDQFFEWMKRKV